MLSMNSYYKLISGMAPTVLSLVKRLGKQKFLRYGLPFFILIVGGSFGLKEFTEVRYKFSRKHALTHKEIEKYGISMKEREAVTLEAAFEDIKKVDIENWENIRIPRPWEDTSDDLKPRPQ